MPKYSNTIIDERTVINNDSYSWKCQCGKELYKSIIHNFMALHFKKIK